MGLRALRLLSGGRPYHLLALLFYVLMLSHMSALQQHLLDSSELTIKKLLKFPN